MGLAKAVATSSVRFDSDVLATARSHFATADFRFVTADSLDGVAHDSAEVAQAQPLLGSTVPSTLAPSV